MSYTCRQVTTSFYLLFISSFLSASSCSQPCTRLRFVTSWHSSCVALSTYILPLALTKQIHIHYIIANRIQTVLCLSYQLILSTLSSTLALPFVTYCVFLYRFLRRHILFHQSTHNCPTTYVHRFRNAYRHLFKHNTTYCRWQLTI